jgi:hypothetical protein
LRHLTSRHPGRSRRLCIHELRLVKYAEIIATTAMIAAASDVTADGAAAPSGRS